MWSLAYTLFCSDYGFKDRVTYRDVVVTDNPGLCGAREVLVTYHSPLRIQSGLYGELQDSEVRVEASLTAVVESQI